MATMYNRPGGFGCDYKSNEQLIINLTKHPEALDKGALAVMLDNPVEGNKNILDIEGRLKTLLTETDIVIEVKERPDTAMTYFNKYDPIIETGKTEEMKLQRMVGKRTYYCYIFKDGDYALWEITDDTVLVDLGEKEVKPHTQCFIGEPKKLIHKWGLPLKAALYIGNIND